MADRPVFIPNKKGKRLVDEQIISFKWHPGMAPSQKIKNVAELHDAAAKEGLAPLLEISSKSNWEIGKKLSAFHQKTMVYGKQTSIECAFQGSKVFEFGGPYEDIYEMESRDAKRDDRLKNSGRLTGFSLEGKHFPLSPPTLFYDWLYVNALFPHRTWLDSRLRQAAGFTDIEFNPERSVNCQARSCALFVALESRHELENSISSFEYFQKLLGSSSV